VQQGTDDIVEAVVVIALFVGFSEWRPNIDNLLNVFTISEELINFQNSYTDVTGNRNLLLWALWFLWFRGVRLGGIRRPDILSSEIRKLVYSAFWSPYHASSGL
jgi:hypothetical protein